MRSIYLAALFSLASLSLWGQATSQIQGIIKDSTGASIGAAEIRATQTSTGQVRSVSSAADGVYVLPSLPIGPYRLEVSKAGFSTYVQNGIVLQVNTNPTIDVTLNLGEVSTQVQVEANAALVDTQGTSVGAVIEQKRIVELPLNGRNPVELIQLSGAAVPAGRNGTAGMPGGLNISIAGGLPSGVGYALDGTNYNNPFDSVNLPFPFPDALQEFKVETNAMQANNGGHAAGAVNASVKSGTNEIHGNLFEFVRNGKMNARNFFAANRDTLKRNQFGGTVGGPIKKNKIFFFGGYQGTYTRQDPSGTPAFVPTAAMMSGDFSQCATIPNLRDPLNNNQFFPGKIIPQSRISPQAVAIAKFFPTPQDACGTTKFGPVQKINEHQAVGRVDYQLNDKQMLFGRYMATTFRQPSPYAFSGNILDTTSNGFDNLAQTVALGHTYLIRPTTVNTFRAAYNRVAVRRFNADYFSPCDVGVKNFTCFVPHQTVVTVSGGPSIGAGTGIDASFIPSYVTLSDDVNLIRGSHQIAVGFSGYKYQHSQKANVFSAASLGFNGQVTTSGLADFALGQIGSLTQGSPNTTFTNKWSVGGYIQDTWKASRRLTVNLGMRWEPFLPQGVNNNAFYNFSLDRVAAGIRSAQFHNAPAGLLYAGDPGTTSKTAVARRYNQWAPRVGLSFDPNGDGKTVIRVAAGIAYDFPNIQIASTPTSAPPFGNALTGITGPLPLANPWSAYADGVDPFSKTYGGPDSPFVPRGSYVAMQPDAKPTTVYSWNFAIQHQFSNDWLVSATYMGNQQAHIWYLKQANPALILNCGPGVALTVCNTSGNTDSRRIANRILGQTGATPPYSYVDQFESGGTGSYHGLLLAVQKRLSRNVSFNANYTWSHCIADINAGSWVGSAGGGLTYADNRRFDRGNCQTQTGTGANQSLDRRHIVNITSVLESPAVGSAMVRRIVGGWRASPSLRYLSGAYQSVSLGIDRQLAGVGGGNLRPIQVDPNPLYSNAGASCPVINCVQWINPTSFLADGNYQPGYVPNVGRSNIPGPSFVELDVAVSRVFKVGERRTLEARGESFNLTNSTRFNSPVLARNSGQFGQIRSAQDPRIMQVALKFYF